MSANLTTEQIEQVKNLTLDYAILVLKSARSGAIYTDWAIDQLEAMKSLPIDASVITGRVE